MATMSEEDVQAMSNTTESNDQNDPTTTNTNSVEAGTSPPQPNTQNGNNITSNSDNTTNNINSANNTNDVNNTNKTNNANSGSNDSRANGIRNVMQNVISTGVRGVHSTRNVLSSIQQRIRSRAQSQTTTTTRNGLNGPNSYNPHANDTGGDNSQDSSIMTSAEYLKNKIKQRNEKIAKKYKNRNNANSTNNTNNTKNGTCTTDVDDAKTAAVATDSDDTSSSDDSDSSSSDSDESDTDAVMTGNAGNNANNSNDTEMKEANSAQSPQSPQSPKSLKKSKKSSKIINKKLILDELTCNLCFDIFYEPLTIVCGHTFCRECLTELLSKCEKKCPLCRTICHINPDLHCINLTINNLIMKIYPKKYKKRKKAYLRSKYPNKYRKRKRNKNKNKRKRTQSTTNSQNGTANTAAANENDLSEEEEDEEEDDTPMVNSGRLPMFVLNSIRLPTQKIALHLFEPRYLHMINRVVSSDRHFGYLCREIGRNESNGDRGYRPYVNDIALFSFVTECEFLPDGRCLLEAKCAKRIKVVDAWVERGTQGLWYAKYEDYNDSPLSDLNLTSDNLVKLNEYCDVINKFVNKCYNDSSRYILQQIEKNCGERINLNKNANFNNYSEWSFFVLGLIMAFKNNSERYSLRELFRTSNFYERIETVHTILKNAK